jgi:biopolymer transport protein ExbB
MLQLLPKGGWVMYVIVAVSVFSLALIIERLIYFLRLPTDEAVVDALERALDDGELPEAVAQRVNESGPVTTVVTAALDHWRHGVEGVAEAINFAGNRAVEDMEKNLGGLAMVAQGAPLLGLLGTVTGMIETFMRIEQLGGQVDPSGLAGGIWEALLTTAAGLVVAVPALFAYHAFQSRVDRWVGLIQDTGQRLIALRREWEEG